METWLLQRVGVSRGGAAAFLTLLLPDGGVLTVGQRAGGAVAHPRDVVFVATEALALGPDERRRWVRAKLP